MKVLRSFVGKEALDVGQFFFLFTSVIQDCICFFKLSIGDGVIIGLGKFLEFFDVFMFYFGIFDREFFRSLREFRLDCFFRGLVVIGVVSLVVVSKCIYLANSMKFSWFVLMQDCSMSIRRRIWGVEIVVRSERVGQGGGVRVYVAFQVGNRRYFIFLRILGVFVGIMGVFRYQGFLRRGDWVYRVESVVWRVGYGYGQCLVV